MDALGIGAAVAIGLSLGLLGGGGSILTVPVFVYLLGYDARTAVAMSLAVVGVVSLIGAIGHWRAGRVEVRMALLFGVVAMIGTYLGARLAVLVAPATQLVLFGVVMIVAAFLMLRPRDGRDALPEAGRLAGVWIALEGLGVGILTGLVGVGGGFLIVPALVLLGRVPMKHAVGTSLLVIALKSAAGVAGYIGQVALPWMFIGAFTGVASAGILAGTALVRFVPQRALQRAFAVFLIVVGTYVLYENRSAVMPRAAAAAAEAVRH